MEVDSTVLIAEPLKVKLLTIRVRSLFGIMILSFLFSLFTISAKYLGDLLFLILNTEINV